VIKVGFRFDERHGDLVATLNVDQLPRQEDVVNIDGLAYPIKAIVWNVDADEPYVEVLLEQGPVRLKALQ
jgi:hypothetical protein